MSSSIDFLAPRRCCRDPVPEIFEAAHLLDRAVGAHIEGEIAEARELISRANIPAVRSWTESLWGSKQENPDQLKYIRLREIKSLPPVLDKVDRLPVRMPNANEQAQVIERDGYHCVFCGIPVIRKEVRVAIHKTYPEEAIWGRTNIGQHAALQCMWLQFDHVMPHSRGGTNDLDNIVVTCAPCNYAKAQYTIEQLGLQDPRGFPRLKTSWDGLERFLIN